MKAKCIFVFSVLNVGGYGFWIVGFYSIIHAMRDCKWFTAVDKVAGKKMEIRTRFFLVLGRYALGRQAIEPEETVRFQKIMETELLPRLDCIYQMQSTLELPNLPGKKVWVKRCKSFVRHDKLVLCAF